MQGCSPESFTLVFATRLEIAADEIAFYKNVRFLRKRMEIGLFKDLLCTQLVTRGIINGDYAEDIMDNIKFQWNEDNNFAELIKFEIMRLF